MLTTFLEPPSSLRLCRRSEKGLISGGRLYFLSSEINDAVMCCELKKWVIPDMLDKDASKRCIRITVLTNKRVDFYVIASCQ